jgi:hypothetical protein
MHRRPLIGLLAVPLVLGCTTMGAWLYDDPAMSLRSVTVRYATDLAAGADSLELLFLGCNRNDYDLMSDNFSAQMAVSGRTVAVGTREQPVFLGTRDTSSFVVVIPLQQTALARGSSTVPFELQASGVLRTPIGNRDVNYRFKGRVETVADGVHWRGDAGPTCRPGLSQVQGVFDRRAPLSGDSTGRAEPPRQDDPNRPGARPDPGSPGPGSRP